MGQEFTSMIVMIIVMVAVFYLMLWRPQKKQQQQHKALLDSLKKGDEVMTVGGLYGIIMSVDEKTVTLEISTGIKVRFALAAIRGKVAEEDKA